MAGLPEVIGGYLRLLDDRVPELVEAVYIAPPAAGSRRRGLPGALDFTAVAGQQLGARQRAELAALHRTLGNAHPPGTLVGAYATWDGLRAALGRPGGVSVPIVGRDGALADQRPSAECWAHLKQTGVLVRGAVPPALAIGHDAAELRAWTLVHLREEWSAWLEAARRPGPVALETLRTRPLMRSVGAAAQSLHALARGQLAPRGEALRFVRARVDPRSQRTIDEALGILGPPASAAARNPLTRRTDALRFISLAVGTADEWAAGRANPAGPVRRIW